MHLNVFSVRCVYCSSKCGKLIVFFIVSGKDVFKVQIASASGKEHVRIHVPAPLDREDGSFLVRYRLYTTPSSDLTVQVLHKNIPVARSPYILQGTVDR